MDFLKIIIPALIPMLIGIVWYSNKLFGNVWMREGNITEANTKRYGMLHIILLGFVFAVMITFSLGYNVVHQHGVNSALQNKLTNGTAADKLEATAIIAMFEKGGKFYMEHRSFGHGALHGCMLGIFFGLALLGTIGLYEGKSYKYVLVHAGFWVISLSVMGGIICAWT